MRFFIYADNLNPKQLKRRAPEHRFLFKAYLPDHTIHFPRWSSQWRSGLASVTPSPGERVWGIVVEITDEDLKILDEFEGEVPQGAYKHVEVTVLTEDERKELVTTHVANPVGKFKVKEHYLDWIIKGVKHWDLPQECLDMWELFRPR
ncbi:MAG: gamma-glutamylcyclotransferase [Nitrospirae bacterium]|nr:MAG: gamma-glutamylcyclotransferase [Nitrospirota bacterium]